MPIPDQLHVENEGDSCPFCLSDEIEGNSTCVDRPYVHQEVRCLNCGAKWYDTYRLIGYDIIDEPEE